MYQIFVVEDELLIRQSIRSAVERMQGPYAFCGEASDGEMALSMMQDLMPDILLTDIRMPFLDGFGLIRHAKAMMPWLKIVIISGYGDFESAQKAIELGVDQYLLKPVRGQEIVRVIEEMAGKIEKEKAVSSVPAGFDADEVALALRQHFLRRLLFGGVSTEDLLTQAQTLNLDIVRPRYLVTVCYFDGIAPDARLLRLRVRKALEQADHTLHDFTAGNQLALLSFGSDGEALSEEAYRFLNILRHELKDICPVITAVIGSPVQRLGAIADAYKTAADLLTKVSGVAAGQVINVEDTAQITADIVNFSGALSPEFQQRLLTASTEDVPGLLRAELENDRFNSMLMRYYALIDLIKWTVQVASRGTPDADGKDIAARISGQHDIFAACNDRETFRETAEKILTEALSARSEAAQDMRYSHVVSRAQKYVEENYADPNMSLLSAAKHVGMSAAHFSTVFSQTAGRSFISYLTAVRMERAKELLRSTTMRLSDIALEIGYNEPNYFSHVFRKTEGMTPKEYRAAHQ